MEQHFLIHDSDLERALKFQRDLQIFMAGYQKMYKQLETNNKEANNRFPNNKKFNNTGQ